MDILILLPLIIFVVAMYVIARVVRIFRQGEEDQIERQRRGEETVTKFREEKQDKNED